MLVCWYHALIHMQDWDILYLNAFLTRRGKPVSPHLVAIRGTVGAMGYIPTPAFARKVVEVARSPKQNAWVDLIFAVGGQCCACEQCLAAVWKVLTAAAACHRPTRPTFNWQ